MKGKPVSPLPLQDGRVEVERVDGDFEAGTTDPSRRFSRMRIREENCNMVLLAVVTLVSVVIAGGASLVGSTDTGPSRLADRTTGYTERATSSDQRVVYVNDQPAVRVVGAPFVPNKNPRER